MKSNMNKVAAAIIGAVAMAGVATTAQAANYASVQLGMADVSGMDSGTAIIGTLGMPMPEVHKNFAFEAEITKALSKPKHTESFSFGGQNYTIKAEADYFTLAGYGVMTFPINPQVDLRGRIGLLYESVKVTIKDDFFGTSASGSDSEIGLAFGFGGTYKLSSTRKVIVEFTQIESDITHLSAGVQFQF